MHVVPIRNLDDSEELSATKEIRVFTAGKAESAFVWWVMDKPVESEEISGWEVYRYCHYPGCEKNDEWLFEGKMYVDGSHCRSCLVRDLNDSSMYRFSVRCLYANVPPLAESVPSAPCMVESPLPAGWLRIFDNGKRSFYYANVRTRESRWDRPEVSPFFLEESVAIYFTATELHYLKALYKSEQRKIGAFSVLGFRESLLQVGESEITDQQLTVIFKNFLRNKDSTTEVDEIVTWTQFMDIMRCLKKMRMKMNTSVTKYINSLLMPPVELKVKNRIVLIADRRRRNIRRPRDFGDWVESRDPIENIPYYQNKRTGVVKWDIPLDVRTHLSPESEAKYFPNLDAGDLETLRQYFDCLDRTQTGSLSLKDLWPVADALVLKLGNSARRSFLWVACKRFDRNHDGYVGFEEFCRMIHCLVNRGATCDSLLWKNVDFNYDYGGSNCKKRVPESKDIPITLLNAIGVSVLSSFDKWLVDLQTGGDSRKKKPTHLWSEARVVRKVLPVTEVSSKETIGEKRVFQPAVPHDSSCFCGCRGLRTMTTNSTTRL